APCDWGANLPVSNDSVLSVPEIGPDTEMASAMLHSSVGLARDIPEPLPALGRRRSQLSVVGHPDPWPGYSATGSWRPKPRVLDCVGLSGAGRGGRSGPGSAPRRCRGRN